MTNGPTLMLLWGRQDVVFITKTISIELTS